MAARGKRVSYVFICCLLAACAIEYGVFESLVREAERLRKLEAFARILIARYIARPLGDTMAVKATQIETPLARVSHPISGIEEVRVITPAEGREAHFQFMLKKTTEYSRLSYLKTLGEISLKYGPLFYELDLNVEQINKLEQLLVDRQLSPEDIYASLDVCERRRKTA